MGPEGRQDSDHGLRDQIKESELDSEARAREEERL